MSALSAIEAPAPCGPDATDLGNTDIRGKKPRLVIVTPTPSRVPAGESVRAGGAGKPRSSSIAPGGRQQAAACVVVHGTVLERRQARPSPAPIRLTRRGRVVVASLLVTGLTVCALLLSLLASGGAQATNHGQPRAGYEGMRQVVVRPGQTLWSIAAAAEPSADTRVVVQEIMTANALTSVDISAGQLLWVPR
jgi:LysM domain